MKTGMMALGIALAAGSAAHGELVSMSADMTADQSFVAYVSTEQGVAGDEFLFGGDWTSTHFGFYNFDTAGTYYLHIMAAAGANSSMFIGQFSFDNDNASWGDGKQHLLTDASNGLWSASSTGFDGADEGVIDRGENGMAPWGHTSNVWVARYMWAAGEPGVAYYSAVLNVVPAPASAGLLGLGGLVAMRRRR